MDRVVAAMKYHVFRGRYGCLLMDDSREGVTIAGSDFIAGSVSGSCLSFGVTVIDSFSSMK